MMWVDGKQIVPLEWMAVYYDNPDVVPVGKLCCDTVVPVPEGFEIPENSEGMIQTELAGGDYAIAAVRVENHDFATPWYQFSERLLQDSVYAIVAKPCSEAYMSNGMKGGYWDTEMYVSVQLK